MVLDISAQWCGPCKDLEPVIKSVANECDERDFLLTKLEAGDENIKIAGRYHVREFPTVIAFIKNRFHSVQSHDFIRCFIDKNLAKFK
ncbi:thioredoxin [Isorropodon fossajaponicum endosymbiont JTNG4]|uniref:thioredoxin family protein n=1 Tax=Isorropodon fossajaponicum symbiont TaxID=883811 RepID=UPI001937B781|nr:thioredoxin domain-containing protein [Isorropodon fossajaponicum symbiont]BBB24025.1 thioredoxin [Isorropodon fossajaponicum endosymbiont JTNG4]